MLKSRVRGTSVYHLCQGQLPDMTQAAENGVVDDPSFVLRKANEAMDGTANSVTRLVCRREKLGVPKRRGLHGHSRRSANISLTRHGNMYISTFHLSRLPRKQKEKSENWLKRTSLHPNTRKDVITPVPAQIQPLPRSPAPGASRQC